MKQKIIDFSLAILYIIIYILFYSFLKSLLTPLCKSFTSIISNLIIIIIYIVIKKEDFKKDFKNIHKTHYIRNIILFIILFSISEIALYFLPKIFGVMVTNQAIVTEKFKANILISSIESIIIAPIYEEILFRKNFKKAFGHKWTFVIITGIIFGSIHLLSISSLIELVYAPIYIGLGIWLSYIYYSDDNILVSMKYHMLNNLLSIVFLLII